MPTRLAPMLLLTGLALLGPVGTASAHGDTISFKITAQVDGHTRSVATWDNDGDPVTESVAATLSAVSDDGRSVGPWVLAPLAGSPGTFTTGDALPPGHWKVSVESGFPALGHGQAEVSVTAVPAGEAVSATPATGPAPARQTPVQSPSPQASRSTAASPGSSGIGMTGWIAVAVSVTACAVLALCLAVLRRRAH